MANKVARTCPLRAGIPGTAIATGHLKETDWRGKGERNMAVTSQGGKLVWWWEVAWNLGRSKKKRHSKQFWPFYLVFLPQQTNGLPGDAFLFNSIFNKFLFVPMVRVRKYNSLFLVKRVAS